MSERLYGTPHISSDDFDAVIARKAYGNGSIVFFGDVSMELPTVQRVLGYCKQCSPGHPADGVATISEEAFVKVMEHKSEGNTAFTSGEYAKAAKAYEAAIIVYGERGGKKGEQVCKHTHTQAHRQHSQATTRRHMHAPKTSPPLQPLPLTLTARRKSQNLFEPLRMQAQARGVEGGGIDGE